MAGGHPRGENLETFNMYSTLSTPVYELSRIGKTTAQKLKKLGIETAKDLVFYFPYRYDDFSKVLPISKISGEGPICIKGKIELIKNKRSPLKRKIITEALISDGGDSVKAIWFNQPYLIKVLKVGDWVYLAGKITYDYYGTSFKDLGKGLQQFVNPSYEKARKEQIHTARLVPIYSITENLTQKQIRFLIKLALVRFIKEVKDWLPLSIKQKLHFIDLPLALQQIHFPSSNTLLEQARRRLKFDELFLLQLRAEVAKYELGKNKAFSIPFKKNATQKFVKNLPFKLTNAQRIAAWEILKDLEKTSPMNRLLEGEVGSGKTVVASMAILNTVLSGFQVVFMAPTEILACQHFKTLSKLLKGFKIGLLTRTNIKLSSIRGKAKKKDLLERIAFGKINVVIGTQALIQEGVEFKNLALIVIDEQHRFGVEQRAKLAKYKVRSTKYRKNKLLESQTSDFRLQTSVIPHFLSMTATPIPRTLGLTLYGDLDLSIIDEMPSGRKKVVSRIVMPEEREKAYKFIKKEIERGRQIFVICPRIEPANNLQLTTNSLQLMGWAEVKAVKKEFEKLSKEIFPDLKVGILHGKMKTQEKEDVMKKFLKNEIDILVATSVVEVGIDVPNATVMMIEGAERFGLAQLHQFRGRVGRSSHQAYCFLFVSSVSEGDTSTYRLQMGEIKTQNFKVKERLEAFLESENGFELAEKDLKFRGPGEVFGTKQSGFPELKIATLNDYAILKEAQKEAQDIIKIDPEFKKFPELKEKLKEFEESIHLE